MLHSNSQTIINRSQMLAYNEPKTINNARCYWCGVNVCMLAVETPPIPSERWIKLLPARPSKYQTTRNCGAHDNVLRPTQRQSTLVRVGCVCAVCRNDDCRAHCTLWTTAALHHTFGGIRAIRLPLSAALEGCDGEANAAQLYQICCVRYWAARSDHTTHIHIHRIT